MFEHDTTLWISYTLPMLLMEDSPFHSGPHYVMKSFIISQ